jgi:hypothetical protein
MDAAIAWSYNLPSPDEQAIFRALSVFAGGFTLQSAVAVVEWRGPTPSEQLGQHDPLAALDPALLRAVSRGPANGQLMEQLDPQAGLDPVLIRDIASLARQNMLIQDATASDLAPSRVRMLEPLRLFALTRLREAGEEQGTRLRHAQFFARLAETLDALTLAPIPRFGWSSRSADSTICVPRSTWHWPLARTIWPCASPRRSPISG